MKTFRDVLVDALGDVPSDWIMTGQAEIAARDAYRSMHSEWQIPQTLNYSNSGEPVTFTWTSGISHDPSSTITTWRGLPAAMYTGDEAFVKIDDITLMDLRVAYNTGQSEAYKVLDPITNRFGRAFAIMGDNKTIGIVEALTNATCYVFHYEEPPDLINDDSEVIFPHGAEQVLKKRIKLQLATKAADIPGLGVSRNTVESLRADYYKELITAQKLLVHVPLTRMIPSVGEMTRHVQSLQAEFRGMY